MKHQAPDNFLPKLLKETADQIIDNLLIIFNHSLDSGVVTTEWKWGDISPIVVFYIVDHLESNNLIRITQHTYMHGRSCITN
jgi:hypothetical protein